MRQMESAPRQDALAYQDRKLAVLIEHAYNTVPYYRDVFDKRGLKPADIQSRADLVKLPVLTKKIVKANYESLRSRVIPIKKLREGHTSGTTGTPLRLLYDSDVITMAYAALDRHYRWAGVRLHRLGDRIAVLRGNMIVPLKKRTPPFWRFNWFHNQMLLSSFHLTAGNLEEYFNAISNFKARVLDGYPSSAYVLARLLLNQNRRIALDAVITSSETLYDYQREVIEEAFQCRVFDYYAAAERVVFASECRAHKGRHLFPEYGITEITENDGSPVAPGRFGNLTGTSLHNYAMPMIRYITGDRTAIKTKYCKCGCTFPLIEEVTTKAEDIIRLPDGRLISPSVLTHPFKPLSSINGSQLVQTDADHLLVRLIPGDDFKPAHAQQLVGDLRARLGDDMRVDVEYIEELPRTDSGKFKWVVSHVDPGI
jgi:phenylacetate-CoA ligase